MFDEFMYYISNNSPKLAPLSSPAPPQPLRLLHP